MNVVLRNFFVALLLGSFQNLVAQEKPPRPIIVTVVAGQGLIFGAFYQVSSSGTVILSPTGARSSTGGVILANLGFPFSPSIYNIDANTGTLLTYMPGPNITMTGSNGGSISLAVGGIDQPNPFVTTAASPATTQVRVGGTLTIGPAASNPPGNYSGTFSVTFVYN